MKFSPPVVALIESRWSADVVRRDICADLLTAFGLSVTVEQISEVAKRHGMQRSPNWSEKQRKSRLAPMERLLEQRWKDWAYPVPRADAVVRPAERIRYEGGFSMLGGRIV
jgi:hypothetical protein